jgi:formiminoglutamase
MSIHTIIDFLEPINIAEISNDEGYKDTQIGKHIIANTADGFPDIDTADIVIIGCGEMRGSNSIFATDAPNIIRSSFYNLFHWHKNVVVADLGNIKLGASLQDTYAAIKTVIQELHSQQKKVVIIGGSHDCTLAQYAAYAADEKIIEATCVDAKIDLNMDSILPEDNFLMEMLTGLPNFIKHYNHIGFQSYFVHPTMLETIDKLRFDCFRVGRVKEIMEEMEPAIRNSHLFSFDIAAIQHAHAPANATSPNGFTGEEACVLMQYAGMSTNLNSIGIYGYIPIKDSHELTAKQISHMLWYYMDGLYKAKQEYSITERAYFNEFYTQFAEVETLFLQSKTTGRWWMQLPNNEIVACTKADYIIASNNDMSERYLRAVERM